MMIAVLALLPAMLTAQYVPHNVNNTGVYVFLDELATDGIIELKGFIKPYSRMMIAEKL
ncbi:MAG: hypothetical protein R6U99_10260 [Nioella sp.]